MLCVAIKTTDQHDTKLDALLILFININEL